jgi:hypothetical protein
MAARAQRPGPPGPAVAGPRAGPARRDNNDEKAAGRRAAKSLPVSS